MKDQSEVGVFRDSCSALIALIPANFSRKSRRASGRSWNALTACEMEQILAASNSLASRICAAVRPRANCFIDVILLARSSKRNGPLVPNYAGGNT